MFAIATGNCIRRRRKHRRSACPFVGSSSFENIWVVSLSVSGHVVKARQCGWTAGSVKQKLNAMDFAEATVIV
jgi:hypothetical protein